MKERAIVVVIVTMLVIAVLRLQMHHDVVLGAFDGTTTTALPGPTVVVPPTTVPPATVARAVRPAVPLKGPNGQPWGTPLVFRSDIPVPADLVFVLVAGSDARPNEDIHRTRADSIHLLAVNPRTLTGTVVGLPRDSWVEVPGHGQQKINQALALGGPQLLADTVRNLTGLPIHYYVLTGFTGLSAMVDELNGVDVFLDRPMNDRNSGARFAAGWQHFNGAEALAYSRDRHSVPNGDFSRSENQGRLILATLAKARAEIEDDSGIDRWLGVLFRHAELDAGLDAVRSMAGLARNLDPAAIANVVVPGRVGYGPGGQSVVYLGDGAAGIFLDLRADATLGGA
jgi:LCP family protein required for cell wall assembly